MQIESVTLKDRRFVASAGVHTAVVILETDGPTVCLQARAAADAPRVARGLAADALRQLKGMPEHRRQAHPLRLRPGSLRSMTQSA
ncbi:hypothetical protein [Roseovarius salinarum]|uniref:hypothetical protein n=1 Tax=Roseovarius salinarum TaxID=1981892 RepID=UPI000C3247BC|nr:hypothetical protein [Roseovarius salinarum]